jgi:hypothetical protein
MISHYALHVRNMSLKSTRAKYLDIVAERNGISGGIPDISRFDDNAIDMPKNLRAHWEKANYAAMVEDMDTSIGIVLMNSKPWTWPTTPMLFLPQTMAAVPAMPRCKAAKPKCGKVAYACP